MVMVAVREVEPEFELAKKVRGALPVPLLGWTVSQVPPLTVALQADDAGSVNVALPTNAPDGTTARVGSKPYVAGT